MGSKHSPRPNWQPTAWAGPQPSQTHRGPHRRGLAAGRGRAAYCNKGHGDRPGAPRPGRRDALPRPRGQTVPAPQDQEGESGATRAWHLLGADLKGPDTRPARPAEPARCGHRPSLRVSASRHVGGGAGGGAQVRCGASAAGKGSLRRAPGFGPSSQEAPPPQSPAPPGWVT